MTRTLIWQHLDCNDDAVAQLTAALGLHPTVARLLCMRGFSNPFFWFFYWSSDLWYLFVILMPVV